LKTVIGKSLVVKTISESVLQGHLLAMIVCVKHQPSNLHKICFIQCVHNGRVNCNLFNKLEKCHFWGLYRVMLYSPISPSPYWYLHILPQLATPSQTGVQLSSLCVYVVLLVINVL